MKSKDGVISAVNTSFGAVSTQTSNAEFQSLLQYRRGWVGKPHPNPLPTTDKNAQKASKMLQQSSHRSGFKRGQNLVFSHKTIIFHNPNG